MDTDSFIVHVKTDDIYKILQKMLKLSFDTSDYQFDRLLPKGKNKKVIGLMKDELRGRIVTKFVVLRAKFIVT